MGLGKSRINIIGQNGNDGLHYGDVVAESTPLPCVGHAFESEVEEERQRRKQQPVTTGVLYYFPDAIKEVANCSYVGNNQHHPEKELHWDRNKSTDEVDALVRHLIDHSQDPYDDDGVLHLAKVAWRALAALQKHLEKTNL